MIIASRETASNKNTQGKEFLHKGNTSRKNAAVREILILFYTKSKEFEQGGEALDKLCSLLNIIAVTQWKKIGRRCRYECILTI